VTPLWRFRNTFRSRAMPKALLNRKTGKQRPSLRPFYYYDPLVSETAQKATDASAGCQTAVGFPAHAPAMASERAKPRYVGLLAGTVEVFGLG
jgi:hypothetical protein